MPVNETIGARETVVAVIKRGIVKWKIYYGDGSVVCSEETTWDECPDHDVQVVLLFRESDAGGRLYCDILSEDDEYRLPENDHVKYGKWAKDNETYQDIYRLALNEVSRVFDEDRDSRGN